MGPTLFIVVVDANVLYPLTLRDTVLRAAVAGFYPPPMSAYDYVESLRAAQGRLLGVRQLADRLRISTATVYKLCDKGNYLTPAS
jgi:hypothetical protein